MTEITFYNYTGEQNRINKTLTGGVVLNCNFNIEYNLINPTIRVTQQEFMYNYCYIKELNRYYFIDRTVIKRNGYYECYLTLDALMTYKDTILTQHGTLTRSQKGTYVSGTNIPYNVKTNLHDYKMEYKFPIDKPTTVIYATGYK